MPSADVVIIGGGAMGSSIAWHLRDDGFRGRVVVIERDPGYTRASSQLAMGGIRQQFGSAVNVALMQHSVSFWRRFDATMSVGEHVARAWFRERGYLFLVDDANAARFEQRLALQCQLGARVERLSVDQIAERVPDLRLDDIHFGVYGPEDGYADPREVLAGFRAGSSARGVEYRADEVVGIEHDAAGVQALSLASGERLASRTVVNAAGPWAAQVARLAGLELPIVPQRQHLFRCALPEQWPYRFPMVVDPTGVHWRHEDPDRHSARDRIIVARTRTDEPAGEEFACDETRWTGEFRAPLVARMPRLAAIEYLGGWAGLYEITPDHNPLIGAHPTCPGLLTAAGFSGHGLMMSPAIGKVMSELIRLGRTESVDVRALAPDRFERGAPYFDGAMI